MAMALEGIKVIDCSQVAAVPMAARILGDFGADVIKIENPTTGDYWRSFKDAQLEAGFGWPSEFDFNFEFGYYNSPQDSDGNNRLIENSKTKFMVGYDKDLGNDLRVGLQYLLEQTLDYDNYQDALLASDYRWDESRHLVTLRLTKLYKSQTVKAGLFVFYSPSDEDIYIRRMQFFDAQGGILYDTGVSGPLTRVSGGGVTGVRGR